MGTKAIYNLFKFIEDKKPQYKTPFKVKLIYAPETLTKEELNVEGDLNLSNTQIQSLPSGLEVRDLWLDDTPIQSLPNDLKVKGTLSLPYTPIKDLPNNLTVKNLILHDIPIKSLPDNLTVKGDLDLSNTPLSKKYTTEEEIKAKYPGIKVKGKIYL